MPARRNDAQPKSRRAPQSKLNVSAPHASATDVLSRYGAFIVAVFAIAASVAGIANQLVYDDVSIIEANERLRSLGNWVEIITTSYWPPPFAPELYRPASSLLFAIERAFGGGSPVVFRVASYLLYAASAIAVFGVAKRVLPPLIALGIGVLFAVHPAHVEAVALAVGQSETVVCLLCALSISLYIDRRRSGTLSAKDWGLIGAAYVIAALTKESGFVLPGLLVAAELFAVETPSARTTWRGYALLAMLAVVVLSVRSAVLSGNVAGAVPAAALAGSNMGGRALTMLQVVPRWLMLFAWPSHLQIDYSPNEIVASTGFGATEALGLLIVVAFVALLIAAWRRAPAVAFGLAWCAVALFPVSNVIVPTGIVLAERTLLLPSAGFLIAVGGLAVLVVQRVWIARALGVACAALVALGLVKSSARQSTWKNGHRLWLAASRDAPRSLRVQQAHREAVEDITKDYERRIASSREPWRLRNELAELLRAMDDDTGAVRQLRTSLELNPAQPATRLQLAALLLFIGEYSQAKQAAEAAMATDTSAILRRMVKTADSAAAVHAPPRSIQY
jgi:hypothetical protein